jgi:hypothetical protein
LVLSAGLPSVAKRTGSLRPIMIVDINGYAEAVRAQQHNLLEAFVLYAFSWNGCYNNETG